MQVGERYNSKSHLFSTTEYLQIHNKVRVSDPYVKEYIILDSRFTIGR